VIPSTSSGGIILLNVHDLVSELFKLGALERFCEEVGGHVPSRTIFDRHLLGRNSVSHEKIANVNMAGLLAARTLAILFEKDGTLIVLVDDILCRIIALCGKEISSPQHLRHDVVHANQFGLGGTAGIDFLSS
jgi:hypothetical protein